MIRIKHSGFEAGGPSGTEIGADTKVALSVLRAGLEAVHELSRRL